MLALAKIGQLHECQSILLGVGRLGARCQSHCVGEGTPGAAQVVPQNVKAVQHQQRCEPLAGHAMSYL